MCEGAIHLEGGLLTRNIAGVMPSPSCGFQSHFFLYLRAGGGGGSLRELNDMGKGAIHLEGGPLTRSIDGVMPSSSCGF